MVSLWDEFLMALREEVGTQVVETWFKAMSLESWDPSQNVATLRIPNNFVSRWIQNHYIDLIKNSFARILNARDIKVLFVVETDKFCEKKDTIFPATKLKNQQEDNDSEQKSLEMLDYNKQLEFVDVKRDIQNFSERTINKNKFATQYGSIRKQKSKECCNLNPNFMFNTFIVGPSNSLAHAAAEAICKNVGKSYNPLFIYGGTGLGKTHLLHAIGNELKSKSSHLTIKYETTDHFINDFINCIRFDKSEQFRNKYQKLDLLLLDDIQFLSNKEQTQETFFHIFNVLYEQKKQIVISSDTFPKEIRGLQSRLKSRMECGLIADIQIPDFETKIVILKQKALLSKIDISNEIADFIASRVISNIRELEGALIRIGAFASLTKQQMTLEMAKKVLMTLNEKKKDGILLDNVLKIVAKYYSISITDLRSKKKQKDIALVRQIAFFLMKKLTSCSLQAVGAFIGGRDHSTVIHAVVKIDKLINADLAFMQKLRAIEQEILRS